MMLVLSLLLALVSLLGIFWMMLQGSWRIVLTVDGLFMSLILLAMSGILGMSAAFELRKRMSGSGGRASAVAKVIASGGQVRRGKVESVQFYESNVGEPNKSIVTLSHAANRSNLLVFEGDMRNALPVGQSVEITFRKQTGYNVLVSVSYS
jgi:ABC-type multidrug transport system fused ATPase/permease subunit